MKKQLQQICNNKSGNRAMSVLFTLTLMLAPQFCGAQTAYITNSPDNTVSVINLATNSVTATIKVGLFPYGVSVSPDGSKVYVANSNDATVSVINAATNVVSATISIGGGTTVEGVAFSPDGSKAYVVNMNSDQVSIINTATNTVFWAIATGSVRAYGICVTPDGNKAYVSNYDSIGTVSVLNTVTNTLATTIPVGSWPQGISVSPDGSKVYVANYGSNTVSVINTAGDYVMATIPVGNRPFAVSVSPDGSNVYVTNYGDNSVSVINAATNTVSNTISAISYPQGLSVSPDGSKLYVVNEFDYRVSVINTATNTVTDSIMIGLGSTAFGNFISTYGYVPLCGSKFSIAADTTKLHHYIVTDSSYGNLPLKYSWSWGDGSYDTIPYPSHTYADSGFYDICLSITDSTGCQSTYCDNSFHALRTTNTMVYVSVLNPLTGTQILNSSTPQVNIYPNPFTSQTTISFSEEQKNTTIEVADLPGKEIRTINFTGNQLTLQRGEMSKGIYFMRITDRKGNVVNKKVIIQ